MQEFRFTSWIRSTRWNESKRTYQIQATGGLGNRIGSKRPKFRFRWDPDRVQVRDDVANSISKYANRGSMVVHYVSIQATRRRPENLRWIMTDRVKPIRCRWNSVTSAYRRPEGIRAHWRHPSDRKRIWAEESNSIETELEAPRRASELPDKVYKREVQQ